MLDKHPLVYARQDFIIKVGHQYCWCKLLLDGSVHIGIPHQGHIWYLTDIFHWCRPCMLIDLQEVTNFHQYRILLHRPVWYLPHALCSRCFCCANKCIWLIQWWVPYLGFLVMRSSKAWVQEMVNNPITSWLCPSLYCMINTHNYPMFFVHLLYQGDWSQISPASFFWMSFNPLWVLSV